MGISAIDDVCLPAACLSGMGSSSFLLWLDIDIELRPPAILRNILSRDHYYSIRELLCSILDKSDKMLDVSFLYV